MIKKFIFIILSAIVGITFLGCSAKKITIKSKFPPQIDVFTKKREIAVFPFNDDKISFSDNLEKNLANVKINNKSYFKIIKKDKIKKILKELKLKSPNQLDDKKLKKFGELSGAKIIITGTVKTGVNFGKYRKHFKKCMKWNKKECLFYKEIYQICNTSFVIINSKIEAIDVNSGQIVDFYNIHKGFKRSDSCKNYNFVPSIVEAFHFLSNLMTKKYVNRIAPHLIFIEIELIDNVESINLNDKQEKIFDNSLIYIEHNRIDKAKNLLKKLNEKIGEKSYEIAYNLGVTEEALGNFKKAQKYYNLADKIISDNKIKPNKLIDKAIERVKTLIQKQEILKREI